MVTVSSNEELLFAIELFTGSVIRFTVTKEENRKRPARRLQKEGECARPNKKNGEFWRERWNQKIHDNPELLAKKIDKLTQKRDWLRSRLDANQQNGRPNRMNIEKKLERIEACLSKLTTFSTNQNPPTEPSQCPNPGRTEQTNVVVVSVPQTTPLPLNVDELAINLAKAKELREQQLQVLNDTKAQIQAKKQQIQQARAQARTEDIPKDVIKQRLDPLNEEIRTIRETLQQRKADVATSNQNICAFRKALREQQNA